MRKRTERARKSETELGRANLVLLRSYMRTENGTLGTLHARRDGL